MMRSVPALDGSRPALLTALNSAEGVAHDYIRHGTITLFAALGTATGKAPARFRKRHRYQEVALLRLTERETPEGRDLHWDCDGYATHKQRRCATGPPGGRASTLVSPRTTALGGTSSLADSGCRASASHSTTPRSSSSGSLRSPSGTRDSGSWLDGWGRPIRSPRGSGRLVNAITGQTISGRPS